jgi:hypothetical protein
MGVTPDKARFTPEPFARTRSIAPGRGVRVSRWVVLAALFVASIGAGAAGNPSRQYEYKVKAAFIYNFAKFVQWPDAATAGNRPIVIGVIGENPFNGELEKLANEPPINGRRIVVTAVATDAEARNVEVLYVPASEDAHLPALFGTLRGAPTLTVGETDKFAAAGGIIRLTRSGEKLRFEINMDAADAAALKVSAQLQKLATVVRRRP